MSDLSVNEALALIKQKEKEIQDLLTALADHDGEAVATSRQYFTTAVLWASIAAKI
jgi:hypothetical protein